MTIGQINAAFAAGKLTAKEAADAVIALRPRPSRVLLILAHALPYVLALAAVLSVVLGERRR